MAASEIKSRRKWLTEGIRSGIPICLGYFAVSLAMGISAKNTGLNLAEAVGMSAGMLASAGQFAALTLIGAGAGVLEMIVTTIVVNLRYFLMSCSLTQKFRHDLPLWQKMIVGFFVTDEIFGVEVLQDAPVHPLFTVGAGVIASLGWCSGTAVGVIAGSLLPADVTTALGTALYGMFLAVVIPPARRSRFLAGLVAVSMAASTLFTVLPLLSSVSAGFRIILLTLLLSAAAAFLAPVPEEDGESTEEKTITPGTESAGEKTEEVEK